MIFFSVNSSKENIFVREKQGVVIEVSHSFAAYTGYRIDDLVNKSIKDIFSLLKIGPNNDDGIDVKDFRFLFTKSQEVKFISIRLEKSANENIYIINEVNDNQLEDKFSYLYCQIADNTAPLLILSVPDFILIKASQMILDAFDAPFNTPENAFGRKLNKYIDGWTESISEDIWKEIMHNGRSKRIKECMHNGFKKRTSYWELIITPIKQNKDVKYIVIHAEDITEEVERRQELQHVENDTVKINNQLLKEIINNLRESIFVYDKEGKYIIKNSKVVELQTNSNITLEQLNGISKRYRLDGSELSIKETATYRAIHGYATENDVIYREMNGKAYYSLVNGKPIFDEDGNFQYSITTTLDITDIMEQHKRFIDQKTLLNAIVDNSSNGIFVFDKLGKLLMANSEANKLIYPQNSLKAVGDSYTTTEYFYEDGSPVPKGNTPIYRALRGEKVEGEKIIVRQPDSEMVLEFKSLPLYNEKGEINFVLTFTKDATELVHKERLINNQKQQLEAIIENMSDSVIVYDKDFKPQILNEESRRLLYQANNFKKLGDRLNSTRCLDIYGNDIPTQNLPAFRAKNGEKVENDIITFLRPDKKIHCRVSSSPVFDDKGNVDNIIVCMHDVTDLFDKEKELRHQKELFETIIDSSYENFSVVDVNGNYLSNKNNIVTEIAAAFPNLEEIYKLVKFHDLEGEELPLEKNPAYILRNGGTIKDQIVLVKVLEKEYYLLYSGKQIFDECGRFLYGVGCSRNITEIVKNQKTLEETQQKLLNIEREKNDALEKAIQLKDEFLPIISHELRTRLNVICSAIQAINYVCKDDFSEKAKKYIGMINQNANRQLRLVNNLLDIIRTDAGRIKINKRNMDIVFITRAITESVRTYSSQKGIKLSFKSTLRYKIIGIDDEKFERILLNLLSNAIKFTPSGKAIEVSLRREKGNILIKVQDTGIGLSLVKRFVDALGGTIKVESNVGKGSAFTVSIPDKLADFEENENTAVNLMDNRLVQVTSVEFTDIYL